MSNLLPDVAIELAEKVRLYGEFDATDYSEYPSVSQVSMESYHAECFASLEEQLEDINGKLSSVDKTDTSSIPLATEKAEANEFVMQPEDPSAYMDSTLSFEFIMTDAIFSEILTFPNTTIETEDTGDNITMTFEQDLLNPDLPYPFKNVHLILRINMEYIASGRYDASDAEFIVTYTDLYRGPLDNVGDRGANYLDPVTVYATYFEPVVGNPTTRYLKSGSLWSLNVSESNAVAYTLNNGSSGSINFDFHFTTTSALTKFVGNEIVDSNNSDADFNSSLTMPKYQWTEFTKTQSPNILAQIALLYSEEDIPQNNLYISSIANQLDSAYDATIDALPYGEFLDKESITTATVAVIESTKTKAKAVDSYRINGKQALAEITFYASATYAINKLGITGTITPATDLAALNIKLITVGVTNFETSLSYYDWGVIPDCNTINASSRFATAVFDSIDTLNVVLTHPGVEWLSDNFTVIESEISETNVSLEAII